MAEHPGGHHRPKVNQGLLHPVLAKQEIQRGAWAPRQLGRAETDLLAPRHRGQLPREGP